MKPLLLTFNLLCGADAAYTHQAVSRHGAKELVLPTQNPYGMDGLIAAEAVGMDLLMPQMKKSHPKWAWGILIASTAARGYVVAREVHMQSRLK